jgi:pimeloyl-ACP methyl ester carboxylesterase
MATVEANGVTLGVAHFGDAVAPLVLCAGGTTMLSWPDALCEFLACGGRHVVRYDLHDSGESVTADPDHDAATMDRLFSRSMPDWSDRDAVTEYAARGG